MIERPASIQLAVADLDTTEAFYAGILELPVLRAVTAPGLPEHLSMDCGDLRLVFVEEVAVAAAHPALEALLSGLPKGVGMTLHFQVVGIREIYDALLEEGLEIFYPLTTQPYGVNELWCFDPDGYLVALEEPCR